jgi:hypothetical protein
MCSRDAPRHPEAGPKPPAPRTPGQPLPNCNYRRDLALSLGAVGRRVTGDRPLTCALTRHPDVRPRAARHGSTAHVRAQQIPKPKSQSPSPNDVCRSLASWVLGFGICVSRLSGEMARAAATSRERSGNPDMPQPPAASTPANGPSGAGASARGPGRNRTPTAASGPVASSGRCGRHARKSPTAIADCGR